MRHSLPRAACAVLLLFVYLLSTVSIAQTQDPQQTNPPDPDATAQTTPVDPDRLALVGDTDTPDLPGFLLGSIDTEQYLRMRNSHIRRLRGLMDPDFHPARRNAAIYQMAQREQQLQQAAATGAPDPTTTPTGPINPNAPVAPLPPSILAPWTPLGPAPIPNGQTTGISQAVSGRVTAIVVHPANENIVYVATAQGGVYRSLNGGASWTPLMDTALSLSIGSIALDPLDPTTLFVGTGEGNLSADSFFGVGLYIIKNADTTPQLLGPFNKDGSNNDIFTGRAITRVIVSPTDDNIVFVSTTSGIGGIGADSIPSVVAANLPSRGLYRSTNVMSANPTFAKLTVQPANGGNRGITDIAMDPGNPNVLIAGVNGFSTGGNDGGIWRTTNALAPTPTFTNQQVVGTQNATIQIRFAINRVNDVTTILAATGETPSQTTPSNGSNCTLTGWVRQSVDAGVTWGTGLLQTSGFCNGQCFYDMAPALDPTNSNIIYLGGSANSGGNNANCRGNVLTRTLDGTTFSRIDTGLHADTHAVTVSPSNPNVVYFGSDGGVWRSSNQGTTWSSINTTGFNATQFESISTHPTDRNFTIGGTQDNGTNFFKPDGTWTRADFGDGGFALIDQSATDTSNVTMYHTYFNQSPSLLAFGRVTTVANAHDNGWSVRGCNGVSNNGINCLDNVLFYAPLALGPGTPNTLYYGSDRLYRSTNSGTTMTVVSQGPLVPRGTRPAPNNTFVFGSAISAIGISPQNDNVRIVGLQTGKVFATTTGSSTMVDVTSTNFPVKYVSRAVIDPNDVNTAYVAFSGFGIAGKQIWKTTNLSAAAPTWTIAAAGLPDVPFNAFAVDPLDSRVLYAGSDIGVFISRDGGASWNPMGTGLPRVAVFDMSLQNSNRLLRIATHGRGAWEIGTAKLQAGISAQATPGTVTYGDNVTLVATVTGSNVISPTGTVTFTDGGNTLATASLTGSGPITATINTSLLSAGSHTIEAVFNADNFFDTTTSAAITVQVNPAPLTVTANSKARLYGQPNPALDGSIAGIKNGDNITATFTTAATQASPVGTYPIMPVLADPDSKLGNYTVTSINGTLTINPTPLTITADDKTRILHASNPPFTASFSGFVLGEGPSVLGGTLSCTTKATDASPVGSYPIVCSGLTSTNYAITFAPGTLSIIFAPTGACVKDKEPSHQILHPINADGSTVFNGNGPIDVKFRVCDANGVSQSTPDVASSIRLIGIIQGTSTQTVDLPVDAKPGTPGFFFGEDQEWLYRIDGKSLANGFTYQFRIELGDGTHIDFQFGKR